MWLQVDGVCKVAPLVALLAGDPSMLPSVDAAVRVVQNTDKAAAFACGFARVLEKLVLEKATVGEAIAMATKELSDPNRSFKTTLDDEVAKTLGRVIGEFSGFSHSDVGMKLKPEAVAFPFAGLSWSLPQSLILPLHCAQESGYVQAVEASIRAGGCTASRASIAGACYGAIDASVPADWVENLAEGKRIQELAEKLVAMRK